MIPVVVTVGGVAVAGAIIMYFYVVKCKALVEVSSITKSIRRHLKGSY